MTTQRIKLHDLSMEELDSTLDNIEPLKAIQPGDVLGAVQQLRRFMSQAKSAGFLLYAGFETIGGKTLEDEAVKARRALEFTSARVAQLLSILEKSQAYKDVVARHKTARLERAADEEEEEEEEEEL